MMNVMSLRQACPLPSVPRPIVIIGAGGIVNDAHLPAYRKAGFPVAGIFDRVKARAEAIAHKWSLPEVYDSLSAALSATSSVFDLAVPPSAHVAVLSHMPEGAAVLMQKPMGLNLEAASEIRDVCRRRSLTAAVNFQLRFSPMMLAVVDAYEKGLLGRLVDIEVHLNLVTPWHLFPTLKNQKRVEIISHSIHYLDLIRSLVGDPKAVLARSYGHPSSSLAQTRTSAILDYRNDLRVTLSINHHHDFGRRFQDASFRFEGDEGAMMLKLGSLLNYPDGEPDELWIAPKGGAWQQIPLCGGWFPDAFIGTMANLQRYVAGEDQTLRTSVDDAWHTMALVEACYTAAATSGTEVAQS